MMHDEGKSDTPVVAAKSWNKDGAKPSAEAMERRGVAEGNMVQQNASRTQSRTSAPSALDRVREVAKKDRGARFTALFHHITIDRLREAFLSLRQKASAGVDGVTWEQYSEGVEENLRTLHDRLHKGAYRAKPSRRAYIPKADGRQRALGIASLEDKIVQRAVVGVLNCIYEIDFVGFSYGFRPGRSQHDALDALATGLLRKKVNWVVDADIRDFFNTIDHKWLLKFVEHRIADRRMLQLIRKWLSAGVLEEGRLTESRQGSPQGASVSPLVSNIYLHYVFDLWVQQWRRRCGHGDIIVVRYADDFTVGFQYGADANRFVQDLRERMRKFSLELHPEKTRTIEFGRFAASNRVERGKGKPETFDFLGFTHICAKTKAGRFLLQRRTIAKRTRAKLHEVSEYLRRRRHTPIPEQGSWLRSVVRGYFAYHAVPTNGDRLGAFRYEVARAWYRALRRRGQQNPITWTRTCALADRWLPSVRVLHPWPEERFDANTRRKSPVR